MFWLCKVLVDLGVLKRASIDTMKHRAFVAVEALVFESLAHVEIGLTTADRLCDPNPKFERGNI